MDTYTFLWNLWLLLGTVNNRYSRIQSREWGIKQINKQNLWKKPSSAVKSFIFRKLSICMPAVYIANDLNSVAVTSSRITRSVIGWHFVSVWMLHPFDIKDIGFVLIVVNKILPLHNFLYLIVILCSFTYSLIFSILDISSC